MVEILRENDMSVNMHQKIFSVPKIKPVTNFKYI